MFLEFAVISIIFAVGGMLFGHFEERTSKLKRLLKYVSILGASLLISGYFGRDWFWVFLGACISVPLVVHIWWLPKNGINGWTGEPKEKYYRLRGWDIADEMAEEIQANEKSDRSS